MEGEDKPFTPDYFEKVKKEVKSKSVEWTEERKRELAKEFKELLRKKRVKKKLTKKPLSPLEYTDKGKHHVKSYGGDYEDQPHIEDVDIKSPRGGVGPGARYKKNPLKELLIYQEEPDSSSLFRTQFIKKYWLELQSEIKKVLTPEQWRVVKAVFKGQSEGLNQKEVAKKLRKSPQYVNKIIKADGEGGEAIEKLKKDPRVQKVCKKIMKDILATKRFKRLKG